MQAVLIGGPYDGALGTNGDPGAPVIWVGQRSNGSLAYRFEWEPGRVRYDRVGEARYLYGEGNGEPLEAVWEEARELVVG
jgi:hypothetical protein